MFVPKSKESIKVYEQQNAINKDWELERYFLPKEYALTKLKSFEVHGGDIIVSCAGTIGEIYEIPENADTGVINQALMRVRVDEDCVDKRMFKIAFSNMIDDFTRVHSNGSAIKNIPPFSDLKPMGVLLPSLQEQEKISSYFEKLDNLITLHQQKITLLTKLKKTMLEKMFPKKGTVIPEFRFNGFANAWEQRKLGELYQRNTERNENLIGYDKTISVATMSYKDDGNGASESSLSTYKVLRVGDIAFEGHKNKQFRFGRFVVNDIGTGIMSPRFSALRPLNEMPVNFWKQYIHSESVIRGILVKSTKAGTMMNELVIPEFLNQTIMIPSENEQAVIGQYFASLDNLITLHQRKIDKIKNMKKAMLDQMFI